MFEFLKTLRDILRLRSGPQDMPYSPGLLAGLCLGDVALQFLVADLQSAALPIALIKLVLFLGFIYAILMLRGLTNRFVQTAITIQSCAILFALLLIPAVLAIGYDPKPPLVLTPSQTLFVISSLPISIWAFVVNAHIFRNALSVSFAQGFGVTTLWYLLLWIVAFALHGAVNAV